MTDPYQILGVSPSASDDEVKAAYRKLSQKYHPDLRSENSVMEDIANQKMSEINAAYDEIMNRRRSGQTSADPYIEVRRMIESGKYTDADRLLESRRMDSSAEWNFLKGTICLSRGWLNDAYAYYEKAARLEPTNSEYRAAFNQIRNKRSGQMQGNPYNTSNGGINGADCLCNACECLICADCLTDCLCDCI